MQTQSLAGQKVSLVDTKNPGGRKGWSRDQWRRSHACLKKNRSPSHQGNATFWNPYCAIMIVIFCLKQITLYHVFRRWGECKGWV
jgi:hypothetical protein